jgi:predicted NAD/FAD-binding protein
MRVAIVGGGASGLATAWLLDGAHEVTLYEREPILGGHIRTLGGNVPCGALPPGVRLDAGVIEFDRMHFRAFHAWMSALDVAVSDLPRGGATNLFLASGRHLHSPEALRVARPPLHDLAVEFAHMVPLWMRRRRFLRESARATQAGLTRDAIGRFLSDDAFSEWIRCLLMYAYSTPYDRVAGLSAALAVPMLQRFLRASRWTHLPAGVSSYVNRVARSLRGEVVFDARLRPITRNGREVTIAPERGPPRRFDAVVLAVPPHRMLALLADPSDDERAWFGAFEGATIDTLVHTDTGVYERRGVRAYTEFDMFELAAGGHGYNAYLNRLAGLPDTGPVHYGLAFELDREIDPAKVLHRQSHSVASYTVAALATRDDLRRRNGLRRTYFVGAWLGDGLHEGAVRSALEVSARLGGRGLPGVTAGSDRP